MFLVYVLDDKTELPKQGTYYIVAKDGIYLRKDTGLIHAIVKVEKISFLKEIRKEASLRLPKIPAEMMAQAILFFKKIFETKKSEAIVIGYYSSESKKYLFDAPKQTVDPATVNYKPEGKFHQGAFQLVMSIHCHGASGAFHSPGDTNDESDFDGLHITIGNIDQPYFSIVSSVVVNNNRFTLKPEKIISGIKRVNYDPYEKINCGKTLGRKGMERLCNVPNLIYPNLYGRAYNSFIKSQQFFDLILKNGDNYKSHTFPQEWLSRVSARGVYYNQENIGNITLERQIEKKKIEIKGVK